MLSRAELPVKMQAIDAVEFLQLIDVQRKVFHKQGTWFSALIIAAAGEGGVRLSDIADKVRPYVPTESSLKTWRMAGLIAFIDKQHSRGLSRRIQAQPKLYELLRLQVPKQPLPEPPPKSR